ncbi:13803_t:CDS:2 [Ambispora leptoticha]|uniref:13803_t:CDS:1 n=1 Tax=Ambispora leptoticha TaxID=144679 RepID=A0A9N8ZVE7_9GLOM|nr:13803_t:CDS:2 [Ambispora leptoticha]
MEVSPTFHMLPTPEGSDNSGGADLILSPYTLANPGVFAEDVFTEEEYFFQLEPTMLPGTSTYSHSYMISPQSSPTLPPDMNINNTTTNSFSRPTNNLSRSKSMIYSTRNNNNNSNSHQHQHRYTPLMKQKSMCTNSTISASGTTLRRKKPLSLPLTHQQQQHLQQHPELDPLNPATVSTMMASMISPITPAMLIMKKSKNSSSQNSKNRKDQQKFTDKSLNKQIFISPTLSPSPNNQQQKPTALVMTPAVTSSQPLLIFPNGTIVSPVMTPTIGNGNSGGSSAASSNNNSSGNNSSGRKTTRQNPNSSSPLALGPTATQTRSPQALKPTISPNLKPKLPGALADEVAEQLAQKSNYQNILEGTAQSLGISYSSDLQSSLESRRTTHKAAEQKRRDSLKQSFDELKKVVPFKSMLSKSVTANSNNDSSGNSSSGGGKNGDGTMKNVSKLFLLKRGK